ncbi:MAG: 50S ribosomal protein L15 [Vulcanimicrobiota bacterium]
MDLTSLKPPKGAKKRSKRVGRGGKLGKTCTRGSNGQNCRSGGGKGPGFEGGQTPWYARLPKFRGFKNKFKQEFQLVSLRDLDTIEGTEEITPEVMYQVNLINNIDQPVKVLANGKITKALTVKATKFSKSAKEAIEAAGGKAEVI